MTRFFQTQYKTSYQLYRARDKVPLRKDQFCVIRPELTAHGLFVTEFYRLCRGVLWASWQQS